MIDALAWHHPAGPQIRNECAQVGVTEMCVPADDEDGIERSLVADARRTVHDRLAGCRAPYLQRAAGIADESDRRRRLNDLGKLRDRALDRRERLVRGRAAATCSGQQCSGGTEETGDSHERHLLQMPCEDYVGQL